MIVALCSGVTGVHYIITNRELASSAPSVYFPRLLGCLLPTLRPLSDVAIPFSRFCHFSARAGDDKCIHFAFLFSVATFGDFPSLHFVVSMLLNSITKCSPQNFLRPMVALLAHFAIIPVGFSPSFSSFLFRSFRPHFSVQNREPDSEDELLLMTEVESLQWQLRKKGLVMSDSPREHSLPAPPISCPRALLQLCG